MSKIQKGHDISSLRVLKSSLVEEYLSSNRSEVVEVVKNCYLANDSGHIANPNSVFLRSVGSSNSRIIALPASINESSTPSGNAIGVKWISSYPDNLKRGYPRASGVVMLNHFDSGRPKACLEASFINAARTAASAALASRYLGEGLDEHTVRIGFIGTGPIGREVAQYLIAVGWSPEKISIYDTSVERAVSFQSYASQLFESESDGGNVKIETGHQAVIENSDIIVFATNSLIPYIDDDKLFTKEKVVLHLSLRDLCPNVITGSLNVVDSLNHCFTERTSLHLAKLDSGADTFVSGDIAQLIRGDIEMNADQARIFSPFGMGMLDIAVAEFIYRGTLEDERVVAIDDFLS